MFFKTNELNLISNSCFLCKQQGGAIFPNVKLVKQDIFLNLIMSLFFYKHCTIIINNIVAGQVVGRHACVLLYNFYLSVNEDFAHICIQNNMAAWAYFKC